MESHARNLRRHPAPKGRQPFVSFATLAPPVSQARLCLKFLSSTPEAHFADGLGAEAVAGRACRGHIEEIEEPYRAAKSAELDGEPFMVGALARINNSFDQLSPLAKGLIKGLRWKMPQYNPFENISAQAVEIIHAIEESHKLLNDLEKNLTDEQSLAKKFGVIAGANPLGREVTGVDAIEAPRGTLYHSYKIDENGYITDCNIITPTVSFLKNLEEDVKAYIPNVMKLSANKRAMKIRGLIRAYDPCIACATH